MATRKNINHRDHNHPVGTPWTRWCRDQIAAIGEPYDVDQENPYPAEEVTEEVEASSFATFEEINEIRDVIFDFASSLRRQGLALGPASRIEVTADYGTLVYTMDPYGRWGFHLS